MVLGEGRDLEERDKRQETRDKMLRVFCFVLDTFFVPLLCTKNTPLDLF